jgi:hypothetical protein
MAGLMQGMMEASSRADQAMDLGTRILAVLEDMRDSQGGTARVQYVRRTFRIELDAGGAGQATLDRRAGVDLELISFAGVASAASTGVLLFHMDQGRDPTSLLAVGTLGQYFSDKFGEGDKIPEGRDLALSIVGGPANGWVVVNVSGKALLRPEEPTVALWSEDA